MYIYIYIYIIDIYKRMFTYILACSKLCVLHYIRVAIVCIIIKHTSLLFVTNHNKHTYSVRRLIVKCKTQIRCFY